MKKTLFFLAFIMGVLSWQCSRVNPDLDLKSSLEDAAAMINTAATAIAETKGYDLMTLSDLTKSGDGYSDSITLDLIAGIYDFKPETFVCRHFSMPYWRFEKREESDMLIINIPQNLVFHPRYLFNPIPPDTTAENDFTVRASDYHYYYTFMRGYDYLLTAGFVLDGEDIGMLEVNALGETFADRSYSSAYHFTDDYSLAVSFTRGDTSVSSFALMDGEELILGEENYFVWNNYRKIERNYILTVGDVEIVRSSAIDSIQVFLNGVLQNTAGAVIKDDDEDGSGSVCHRRDILLTFDDGTSAKLSELIGPSLETLKTLLEPMREMYMARRIVDHLAMTIYYQERQ